MCLIKVLSLENEILDYSALYGFNVHLTTIRGWNDLLRFIKKGGDRVAIPWKRNLV